MKKIVVMGGGTGTYVVLSGLKKYPAALSVVVSMMDSGGSTGRLRDQLGVLPPADLRQCLVALSEASDLWRKLFLYRFDSGDLRGHNFGNIFISALEKITNNYQQVIDTASFILKTKGQVLPVTYDKVHLCVAYEDGEVIETEAAIDTAIHQSSPIVNAYLKPKARLNEKVFEAINQSDFIIIGPGDLYTSLIPNLLVEGMAEAIGQSSARVINVMNLMTKQGQTTDYTASDHLRDLEKYLKKKVDVVLINKATIPIAVREHYISSGEQEVRNDLSDDRQVVCADLISGQIHVKSDADAASRSILRHDSDKTAGALWQIVQSSSIVV